SRHTRFSRDWSSDVCSSDLESGLDAPGALLTEGTRIADLGPRLFHDAPPGDAARIDCRGAVLAPGLIDMAAHCGEPGCEHQESQIGRASGRERVRERGGDGR